MGNLRLVQGVKLGPILLFLFLQTLTVFGQWDPNFKPGRTVIVHLFEWKWTDIAKECERFLGPKEFGGVQVSPPNENAVITTPFRPWYERYQPVSYKLITRSGTEKEFIDMVRRCNAVNVRIYVDAVINHMTGHELKGSGTGGSTFDATTHSYPEVPYGEGDFNDKGGCSTSSGEIEDYLNNIQVRNCELTGLRDLNQGKAYVQDKIAEYLNKLIEYGVAGFRIDASKHMWPADMSHIFSRLNNLSVSHGFPKGARPFIVQEVIDLGNEPIKGSDYFDNGRVTEFKYGMNLGEVFRKLNNQKLQYVKNFGEGWGMYPDNNALAFVDNHDNQRGHGAGGKNVLTFRQFRLYKMANVFMLGWSYAVPRLMSSYEWEQNIVDGTDKNDWIGPPNKNGSTFDVTFHLNGTCAGGWVCEHRWGPISNMVKFRNAVLDSQVGYWWDNGENQIAFSRGNKGFVAINNDDKPMTETIQTSLPSGRYCDMISGDKKGLSCTGKMVIVDKDGKVSLNIDNKDEDPMIAIHARAKLY